MIPKIAQILEEFRPCFSRKAAFYWFVIIVFGLIVRTDTKGVTSFIRCFGLTPNDYYCILHFFTAASWQLETIMNRWIDIVYKRGHVFTIAGFPVLIGDTIKVAKEAKSMPGVKKLKQQSNNSKKPPFIFGHHFGVITILAGTVNKLFALPLTAEMQEGVDILREFQGKSCPEVEGEQKVTLVTLMMYNAISVVYRIGKPCLFVLDAFYAVGNTFLMAAQCKDDNGNPLLNVITRAKKNIVAYLEPENKGAKYGKKFKLYDLFKDRASEFATMKLNIYGYTRTISYLCLDLLWKPFKGKLRFVLVKDGNRKMILISSNLDLKPQDIILTYSYRFKIEVSFCWLKNLIGGFCYHFWTKAMEKLDHKKSQIDLTKITDKETKQLIADKVKAIEAFVNFSCIALGILQILSLEFSEIIWKRYSGWLRTKSNDIPSEEVTMNVVKSEYYNYAPLFSNNVIIRVLNDKKRRAQDLYEEDDLYRVANF